MEASTTTARVGLVAETWMEWYVRSWRRVLALCFVLLFGSSQLLIAGWFLLRLIWLLLCKVMLWSYMWEVWQGWLERPVVAEVVETVYQAMDFDLYPEPEPWYVAWWASIPRFRVDIMVAGFSIFFFFIIVCKCIPWKRIILRLRGYRFEAMQAGSQFRAGKMPGFQVPISKVGLFSSSHVGYGIRVGNVLCVPTHVLAVAGPEMVVCGRVLDCHWLESRLHNDVSYCQIPIGVWSTMAITKPTIGRMESTVPVSAMGLKGASSGMLVKTATMGQVQYTGSTVEGYSGCAYYSNSVLYGMHTGVAGSNNIGISADLLAAEIAAIWKIEASEDLADELANHRLNRTTPMGTKWTRDLIEKAADASWTTGDLGWSQGVDIDYNAKINWNDDFVSKFESHVRTLPEEERLKICGRIFSDTVKVKVHSGGEEKVLVSPSHQILAMTTVFPRLEKLERQNELFKDYLAEDMDYLNNLNSRLVKIEAMKVNKPLKAKKTKSSPKECFICGETLVNHNKLVEHKLLKHVPEVKEIKPQAKVIKESAFVSDNGSKYVKTVSKGHFLGKSYRGRKSKTSQKTLKSENAKNQSSLMLATQLKTLDILKTLEKTLSPLVKDTGGLSSAIGQNSDH